LGSEPESNPLCRAHRRPPAEPETATMKVPGLPMTTMVPPTAAKVVPAPPVVPATSREPGVARDAATQPVRHHVVWFDIPVRDLLSRTALLLRCPGNAIEKGAGRTWRSDGCVAACRGFYRWLPRTEHRRQAFRNWTAALPQRGWPSRRGPQCGRETRRQSAFGQAFDR